MEGPYHHIFGQLANRYQNLVNPVWNNRAKYGQLHSQGPPVLSSFTPTASYSSNEPTPLMAQKIDLNTIYESQHNNDHQLSQDPNYNHNYSAHRVQGQSRNYCRASGKLSKGRRYLSTVLLLSKCLSAILSALMESSMVYMMYKFQKTRNLSGPNIASPWAKETKLWPTILLAVASGVTCLMTVGSMTIRVCKSVRKTGKPATGQPFVTTVKYAVHIGTWACVAVAYRLGKSGQDLWGWSCSSKAQAIQEAFRTELNFSRLCMLQSNSWILSLTEVGGKCGLCLMAYLFYRNTAGSASDAFGELNEMVIG